MCFSTQCVLHCFVASKFLPRIHTLLSVKFPGLKMCWCKKNYKYEVWFSISEISPIFVTFIQFGENSRAYILSPIFVKFFTNFDENLLAHVLTLILVIIFLKIQIGRNCCHQNWWNFHHLKTQHFFKSPKLVKILAKIQ